MKVYLVLINGEVYKAFKKLEDAELIAQAVDGEVSEITVSNTVTLKDLIKELEVTDRLDLLGGGLYEP